MIKTIIVDDEPLALDIMESFIAKVPELTLVARCASAIEAGKVLRSEKIDLMYLDIQMPQMTGTEFLKTLAQPPTVIFTTAYPNYALEGFELNVLDYLLKPISMERFMKATNKAIAQIQLQSHGATQAPETPADDFIFVKADKKLIKVNYNDIIYIEGLKDYVIIREDNQRIITLQTMKSLEDKMPSNKFRRIHRSYIVNVDRIEAVMGNMVEVIEKGVAKHLPVGKNYRDDILELVEKNKL